MLVRWTSNPVQFPHLNVLSRQFDEMVRDLFGEVSQPTRSHRGQGFSVTETDEGFTLHGLLPGVSTDALELEATAEALTIRAKRELGAPEGFKPLKRERRAFDLERTFTFSSRIDVENVKASMKDGVLEVTLSKVADARPRKIAVEG